MSKIQTYKSTRKSDTQHVVVKFKTCPHKTDGAVKVAEYIVEEIKRNTKSQLADELRLLNNYRGGFIASIIHASPLGMPPHSVALTKWYKKVNDGCDWDHKPKIKKKFQVEAVEVLLPSGKICSYCYHKYKNFDYFYDVWSNIHYGYVGMACGFSENTLTFGSTAQQFGHSGNFDTSDDKATMLLGIELYKKFDTYALKLTAKDVLDALEACNLSESRQIHWCKNSLNPDKLN